MFLEMPTRLRHKWARERVLVVVVGEKEVWVGARGYTNNETRLCTCCGCSVRRRDKFAWLSPSPLLCPLTFSFSA